MRVDVLHSRLVADVTMLQPVVDKVFPVDFPAVYETRSMNFRSFIDRLNAVTQPFSIFNEITIDHAEPPGSVKVSGLWLDESMLPDSESDADVRIIWHVHPNTKRVSWTAAEWSRRRYFWWQTLCHEQIHRYQNVHRNMTGFNDSKKFTSHTNSRETREWQEYYGDYDEIETHSHSAALEFRTWWSHLTYQECVRESTQYSGRVVVPTYKSYMASFVDNLQHPAYKTFKRKVRSWYDVLSATPYPVLQLPGLV